jgi:two-component system, chemotaxis family, chemotaxis protein CheY
MAEILTVDDSASIRQTIKITLGGAGHSVGEAVNGRDGLMQAGGKRYDLIITDLNMPEMDGLAMIRELRKRQDFAGIPILFLTTESDSGIKQQAKAAGATGWITKPFDSDQLIRIVDKVLAK